MLEHGVQETDLPAATAVAAAVAAILRRRRKSINLNISSKAVRQFFPDQRVLVLFLVFGFWRVLRSLLIFYFLFLVFFGRRKGKVCHIALMDFRISDGVTVWIGRVGWRYIANTVSTVSNDRQRQQPSCYIIARFPLRCFHINMKWKENRCFCFFFLAYNSCSL